LAIGCFFVENHAYFNSGTRVAMNDTEFWLSYVGTISDVCGYLTVAKRFAHAKVNWIVVAFIILFAIDGLLGVTLYPGYVKDGSVVYLATVNEDFRFLASLSVEVFGVYLGVRHRAPGHPWQHLVPDPYGDVHRDPLRCRLAGLIGKSSTSTSTCSITAPSIRSRPFPKSWTTNRNVYGMMLFMGIACEGYLLSYRPRVALCLDRFLCLES
jgi:hypothetical protein